MKMLPLIHSNTTTVKIVRHVQKVGSLPVFWFVMCVLAANFKAPPRPMPNHAPHVLPDNSLRTMVTTTLTTIPLKIASSAHRANIVHWVLLFAIGALQVIEHLKTKRPTKPVVYRARVGVTKHRRVKTSATIAAAENTNLKTVLLFVCPAMLDCIKWKKDNQAAKNAQKTITPTNPNKQYAKLAIKKKPLFKVPPFAPNVLLVNTCTCPPAENVHVVI